MGQKGVGAAPVGKTATGDGDRAPVTGRHCAVPTRAAGGGRGRPIGDEWASLPLWTFKAPFGTLSRGSMSGCRPRPPGATSGQQVDGPRGGRPEGLSSARPAP